MPIYISTRYVYLRGIAGQTSTRTVQIKAELSKPLKLEPTHFDLSSKVIFKIEELEVGKTFVIRFTNIPGSPETYHGVLKLRTNYPEKPEISIRVRGKFHVQKSSISPKTPSQKSRK